jgi:hypothetical protein
MSTERIFTMADVNAKPLSIKEAKDGAIKLTDVPTEGATALIPEPVAHTPRDLIDIYISGQAVMVRQPVGELVGGFFEVPVPKTALLDHTGPKREFKYVLYYSGANPGFGDPIVYDILHS